MVVFLFVEQRKEEEKWGEEEKKSEYTKIKIKRKDSKIKQEQ